MTDSRSEPEATQPSGIDRALRIVGDVRAGEGKTALALAISLFMLLSAYYLLKVARETLVLTHYDAEVKVYIAAAQAAILVPTVWVYGRMSERVGRFRLVTGATVFFAMNLTVFAVLHAMGVPIAVPFFVWVGVFNVFVISQLWAFANDVYEEERGRRLFAVIGLGSSVGAIAGSYGAAPLGELVGTLGLLVLPIAMMLSTLVGVWWVNAHPVAKREAPKTAHSRRGALKQLFGDHWLLLIAAMLMLLNCENTIGEYVLDRVMQDQVRADVVHAMGHVVESQVEERVREFKSYYFGAFNTLGFLLQLVVTGRVMKKGGGGLAIMILPIVALLGQIGMIATGAALMAVAVAKVGENSVDYSIESTGANALFLVVPPETKYKVKVLIDSVVVRLGDMVAGLLVVIGSGVLDLAPVTFACVGAGITVVWLVVVWFIRREHDRRVAALPPKESSEAEAPSPAPRRPVAPPSPTGTPARRPA